MSKSENKMMELKRREVIESIKIGMAREQDREVLERFFEIVLTDTFMKNDLMDLTGELDAEILDKKRCFDNYLASDREEVIFLLAKKEDRIIACIETSPSNHLIRECTEGLLDKVLELGTIFVHPDFQGLGLGRQMIEEIFDRLIELGIGEVCLDSGYKSAQKIWTQKFGTATYIYKDFWGQDAHHMIWRVTLSKQASKKDVKIYNIFLPIWILMFFPPIIFWAMGINFLVDSMVLIGGLYLFKDQLIGERKWYEVYLKSIVWVWLTGFFADFIGGLTMVFTMIFLDKVDLGVDVTHAMMFNPFTHFGALMIVLMAIALTGVIIYRINKSKNLSRYFKAGGGNIETASHKIALALAILTAPWSFLIPYRVLESMFGF